MNIVIANLTPNDKYCRMANFFRLTIFPNFSFLGVSASYISEMRISVFFSFSNFPAHSEGIIINIDKHLVDWRQSPVLSEHMEGVLVLIVKVQRRTWQRDCHQSREASRKRSAEMMYFWKFFKWLKQQPQHEWWSSIVSQPHADCNE